jgi:hypothetical protein
MLADVKPFNSSIGSGIFYFDSTNFPGRRSLAKPSLEILQKVRGTRGVRLHPPVG